MEKPLNCTDTAKAEVNVLFLIIFISLFWQFIIKVHIDKYFQFGTVIEIIEWQVSLLLLKQRELLYKFIEAIITCGQGMSFNVLNTSMEIVLLKYKKIYLRRILILTARFQNTVRTMTVVGLKQRRSHKFIHS